MDAAGIELECRWCDEFWPLDREHWNVRRDGRVETDRCRPCERERNRLRAAIKALDPEYREGVRQKNRRYRKTLRRLHPDLTEAYERERRAILRNDSYRRKYGIVRAA